MGKILKVLSRFKAWWNKSIIIPGVEYDVMQQLLDGYERLRYDNNPTTNTRPVRMGRL